MDITLSLCASHVAFFCRYESLFADEAFFDSEDDHTDDVSVQKSTLLLQYTLDCLHKIFLYDTQRFLSKERAEALLVPLVDQVGLLIADQF